MNLKDWFSPVIVLIVTFGLGYLIRQMIFKLLTSWSNKTKTQLTDILIQSLKTPFLIWTILLGISFATKITQVSPGIISLLDKTILILWIISLCIVISKIVTRIIKTYSDKIQTTLPITTLTQNVTNISVFIVGFLIILNSLGVSITPILTALGVGGLAVALALQDTLSNLFSGIYTIISKQIRVGDYIQLDTGQEGYVVDIGWRATRIRALPNNIIIIPNTKLSQATVTNFYLPEKELAVLVQVGVHYNSDLDKVEKVTIEVAKKVMKEIQGGVPNFEPFIRYHTFGESSINFTVILRAKEFCDKYLISHEFIKQLKARYDKEKIVIPFPIRTVYMQKDK